MVPTAAIRHGGKVVVGVNLLRFDHASEKLATQR